VKTGANCGSKAIDAILILCQDFQKLQKRQMMNF